MASSLSIKQALCALFLLVSSSSNLLASSIKVVWLHAEQDEYYDKIESYTGYTLIERKRPQRAILAAIKESKARARASKIQFEFVPLQATETTSLKQIINNKIKSGNLVILDLPLKMTLQAAEHLAGKSIVLINARHRDDELRGKLCQSNLFHTIPSQRMYMDTLSQWIKAQSWTKILVIHGTTEQDFKSLKSFEKSAARLNLDIKASRPFTTSRNPQDRERNNLKFLSDGLTYDIVVAFDSNKDFSRFIPYQTRLPRPIVGAVGLAPRAWHQAAERFGAPQLNQRFNRKSALSFASEDPYPRSVSDEDFAAWASIKFLANNLPKKNTSTSETFDTLSLFKRYSTATVDLYKGMTGSFRPWNNQLRQPMFLATDNAVISVAPIKGFLHPKNYADTLGVDLPETVCNFANKGKK